MDMIDIIQNLIPVVGREIFDSGNSSSSSFDVWDMIGAGVGAALKLILR